MRVAAILAILMLSAAWIVYALSTDQAAQSAVPATGQTAPSRVPVADPITPSTYPADGLRVLATASPPKDPSMKLAVVMNRLPGTKLTPVQTLDAISKMKPEELSNQPPPHSFNRPGGNVCIFLLRMRGDAKPEQPDGADVQQLVYASESPPNLQPHSRFSATLVWTDEGVGYLILSQFWDHYLTLATYTIPADGKPIGQYPLDLSLPDRPKPATPLDEFLDGLPGYESIEGVNVKAKGGKLIAQVVRGRSLARPAIGTTILEFDLAIGKWELMQRDSSGQAQ